MFHMEWVDYNPIPWNWYGPFVVWQPSHFPIPCPLWNPYVMSMEWCIPSVLISPHRVLQDYTMILLILSSICQVLRIPEDYSSTFWCPTDSCRNAWIPADSAGLQQIPLEFRLFQPLQSHILRYIYTGYASFFLATIWSLFASFIVFISYGINPISGWPCYIITQVNKLPRQHIIKLSTYLVEGNTKGGISIRDHVLKEMG